MTKDGREPETFENLERLLAASVDTEKTPAVTAPLSHARPLSYEVAARWNASVNMMSPLGTGFWISTPHTGGAARVLAVVPSDKAGWMVVKCHTFRGEMLLECTADYPMTIRLQDR